jgi:hypothetical protein
MTASPAFIARTRLPDAEPATLPFRPAQSHAARLLGYEDYRIICMPLGLAEADAKIAKGELRPEQRDHFARSFAVAWAQDCLLRGPERAYAALAQNMGAAA